MTISKLRPAAVRAAGILEGAASLGEMHRCDYEEVINDAIDDHLKSEGWEELRKAVEDAEEWIGSSPHTMREVTASNTFRLRVKKALSRVRGEKP